MAGIEGLKVALLGGNGMLGRAWCALLDERGIAYERIERVRVDLERADSMLNVPADARVVINCAAWTDVDGAEAEEERATRVNGDGVGALAERCAAIGATLVHYSTDYVFAGDGVEPYAVDGQRDPVNAYGRSKAAGERAVERSGCDYLMVRTSWLYGPWAKNFVRTMAGLLAEKDKVRVVDDQRGRPSCCRAVAGNTLALLERGERGIWHVTDGGDCTWYELACEIALHVERPAVVERCDSSEFVRPAARPAYSVLDIARTEAALGPMRDWKQSVADTLDTMARQACGVNET